MSIRVPFLLCLLLLGAGCDRFADEERGLTVQVQDADGNPVRAVEVHALLDFAPSYSRATSLPLQFTLDRLTGVNFEITRRSDQALIQRGTLGLLGPGNHVIQEQDLDLPNGVYRAWIRAGDETILDLDFVLNRVPETYGSRPYLSITPNSGQIYVSAEALSLGVNASIQTEQGLASLSVTDSVTLAFVRPGRTVELHSVRMNPIGMTRLGVRLQ